MGCVWFLSCFCYIFWGVEKPQNLLRQSFAVDILSIHRKSSDSDMAPAWERSYTAAAAVQKNTPLQNKYTNTNIGCAIDFFNIVEQS